MAERIGSAVGRFERGEAAGVWRELGQIGSRLLGDWPGRAVVARDEWLAFDAATDLGPVDRIALMAGVLVELGVGEREVRAAIERVRERVQRVPSARTGGPRRRARLETKWNTERTDQ